MATTTPTAIAAANLLTTAYVYAAASVSAPAVTAAAAERGLVTAV